MMETTTTTVAISTGEVHERSCMLDEQMLEALLDHQSDPISEPPFNMDEDVIITISSDSTTSIPMDVSATRADEIMTEIKTEIAQAELNRRVGGMVSPDLVPMLIVSPGSTIIDTNAAFFRR